jgi:hypothetical protein
LIVALTGGLGNQLFQYAAGQYFAKKLGVPVHFNVTYYHGREPHAVFQLNAFRIGQTISILDEPAPPSRARMIRRRLWRMRLLEPHYVRENRLAEPSANDARIRKPGFLIGYWQNPYYVDRIWSDIKPDFAFTERPGSLQRFKEFKAGDEAVVSVHIRRTDYLDPSFEARVGSCSPEFYAAAIAHVESTLRRRIRLCVFSDDLEWVKANMDFGGRDVLFGTGDRIDPIDDLEAMSLCDHNIIANSTFSWWGAWLNNNPDKIVVAPTPWLNETEPGSGNHDPCPADWQRLPK